MIHHVSDETAARVRDAIAAGRAESADQIINQGLTSLCETQSADAALRGFLEERLAEAEDGHFCEESLTEILAAERRQRAAR